MTGVPGAYGRIVPTRGSTFEEEEDSLGLDPPRENRDAARRVAEEAFDRLAEVIDSRVKREFLP